MFHKCRRESSSRGRLLIEGGRVQAIPACQRGAGGSVFVRHPGLPQQVREEAFGFDDSVTVTSREAPESSRAARRTHYQPIGGGSTAENCAGC